MALILRLCIVKLIFDTRFMLPHLDCTDNFKLVNELKSYFMHGLTHDRNIDKISYRAVGHILMVPLWVPTRKRVS